MSDIIIAPNPVLSEISQSVTSVDKTILGIIDDMKLALSLAKDPVGVGLAAPQIGKSLRIFIAKPTPKSEVFTFINPVITKEANLEAKQKKTTKLEGCLSLPNIWGEVQRYNVVTVEFIDEQGRKHNRKFKGFMATIIQHEIDHLNGIIFTKRVLEQKGTLYKSEKNEKGEDIFEEINI
ncbi:peptide deformylase [Patescibacteria group bacterium]|nr:peptide deformylase [Patescibacteria group bacterium]